jgi:hypothetical protein
MAQTFQITSKITAYLYLLGFCACILSHCSIDPGFLCFFGVDFLRA